MRQALPTGSAGVADRAIDAVFEPVDQGSEVAVQLAGPCQCIDELLIVDLPGLCSADAVAIDLALDHGAERLGDRPVAGQRAEVGPDVVRDGHARHPVAYRSSRLGRGLALAGASSHALSVNV